MKDERDPATTGADGKDAGKKRARTWVSWFATFLGVTMVIIGILLLLWGLAWQTRVGEPDQISGGGLTGGPGLIPFGVVTFAIGLMWIITGWNRFKGGKDEDDLKSCPYCGKRIEKDLNFCYYCNKSFKRDTKTEGESTENRARPFEAD